MPSRFSDAERSSDPILCEEDGNYLFQEHCPSRREWLLAVTPSLVSHLLLSYVSFLIVPIVLISGFRLDGPWFAVLLIPSALVALWSLVMQRRASAPGPVARAGERRGEEVIAERALSAAWEAGMPSRDVVIAGYLTCRLHGVSSQRLFILGALIMLMGASVWAANPVIPRISAFALGTLLLISAWNRSRRWELELWAPTPWLEQQKRRAQRLGISTRVWDDRPGGLRESLGVTALAVFLFAGGIVSLMVSMRRMIRSGAVWDDYGYYLATGLGLCTFAVWAALSQLGNDADGVQRRTRATLLFAERVWRRERTLLDEDSADSRRMLDWLESPMRSPAAPCPELDARWVAYNRVA